MTHQHHWIVLQRVERAPVDVADPIVHTGFVVIGCDACRRASAFPGMNFEMVIEPWRVALVELLRVQGYEFAADESVGPAA